MRTLRQTPVELLEVCVFIRDACCISAGAMSASESSLFIHGDTSMHDNSADTNGGEKRVDVYLVIRNLCPGSRYTELLQSRTRYRVVTMTLATTINR